MARSVILIDGSPADNVAHEKIIRDTFEEAEISIIDDGDEAVRYLSRELSGNCRGKNVVIIDERAQGISGIKILDELKTFHNLDEERLEVYFLTDDESECLVARAHAFRPVKKVLYKPLTPELAHTILRNNETDSGRP